MSTMKNKPSKQRNRQHDPHYFITPHDDFPHRQEMLENIKLLQARVESGETCAFFLMEVPTAKDGDEARLIHTLMQSCDFEVTWAGMAAAVMQSVRMYIAESAEGIFSPVPDDEEDEPEEATAAPQRSASAPPFPCA